MSESSSSFPASRASARRDDISTGESSVRRSAEQPADDPSDPGTAPPSGFVDRFRHLDATPIDRTIPLRELRQMGPDVPQSLTAPAAPGWALSPEAATDLATSLLTGQVEPSPASLEGRAQALVKRQLARLAGDRQGFHRTLELAFGPGYERTAAEPLRQQALAGDFDWLPPLELAGGDLLQGAHAAYDAAGGVVFLRDDLGQRPDLADLAYVEQAGRHLAGLLARTAATRTDGQIFRRLLSGEKLSATDVDRLRAASGPSAAIAEAQHHVATTPNEPIRAWHTWRRRIGRGIGALAQGIGRALLSRGKPRS